MGLTRVEKAARIVEERVRKSYLNNPLSKWPRMSQEEKVLAIETEATFFSLMNMKNVNLTDDQVTELLRLSVEKVLNSEKVETAR